MAVTGETLHFRPRAQIINPAQQERLHQAALEVLERTGVRMTHPRALEILSGHGARVSGDRVRFPSWLVEQAIRTVPSRLVLGDRHGNRSVVLEGDNSFFGPSLDCLDYLDPDTGERVPFTTEHCKVSAGLTEYLPNFHWSMVIGLAQDVPAELSDRAIARTALSHCTKPLVFCAHSAANAAEIFEMNLAIRGGKENFEAAPNLIHYSEPISPFNYFDPAVDKLLFSVDNGIPIINLSAPQLGGSSPASFAGTIVQGCAESLSGLVLAQLARPGAPFVFGSQPTIMDMRTTIFSYGAPEGPLMVGAMAHMAQYYGLPFYGTAGATDAKFNDPQAGIEATFQTLTSALIGSSLVHDCSSWIDHGSCVSPAYMVMVNEILNMINVLMKGVEISEETLVLDIIDKVGPGGNYLQEPHTFKNCRKVWYSDLFDRTMMESWVKKGSQTFDDRLREMTLKAMEYQPEPLAPALVKELDRMQANWK